MRVGARHRDGQRNAASIRKKGTLGAGFASIRWIGPRFSPRPAEPSSSLRRGFANPSRCLLTHHIPEAPPSRAGRTRPGSSIAESIDAAYSTSRTLSALRSTGSPFEGRKESRRRPAVDRHEACRHDSQIGILEEKARSDPKARQKCATVCAEPDSSSSIHPHTGGVLIKPIGKTNSIGFWDRLLAVVQKTQLLFPSIGSERKAYIPLRLRFFDAGVCSRSGWTVSS